jgi:hypothetical protein
VRMERAAPPIRNNLQVHVDRCEQNQGASLEQGFSEYSRRRARHEDAGAAHRRCVRLQARHIIRASRATPCLRRVVVQNRSIDALPK